MKIRFCERCNRMILEGFEFCPYCGVSVKSRLADEPPNFTDRVGTVAASSFEAKSSSSVDDSHGALVLLDRLIRDLEILDDEIANIEIHKF